jgi:hypothetical protein
MQPTQGCLLELACQILERRIPSRVFDMARPDEPGFGACAVLADLFSKVSEIVVGDGAEVRVTAPQNQASQRPSQRRAATHRPIAELEHALNVGIDQSQIQTKSGGDTRIAEAIEVATQDPGSVHSDAVDETQVRQVRASVMGRTGSPADLADTPSVQIQLDKKWLGKPGVQVGPAGDKAVVEVAPHFDASRVRQDAADPGELLVPRRVVAHWGQAVRFDACQCDHRWVSSARV